MTFKGVEKVFIENCDKQFILQNIHPNAFPKCSEMLIKDPDIDAFTRNFDLADFTEPVLLISKEFVSPEHEKLISNEMGCFIYNVDFIDVAEFDKQLKEFSRDHKLIEAETEDARI